VRERKNLESSPNALRDEVRLLTIGCWHTRKKSFVFNVLFGKFMTSKKNPFFFEKTENMSFKCIFFYSNFIINKVNWLLKLN